MGSRVENRRGGFGLPVAVAGLSPRRLNPVWLDPVFLFPLLEAGLADFPATAHFMICES